MRLISLAFLVLLGAATIPSAAAMDAGNGAARQETARPAGGDAARNDSPTDPADDPAQEPTGDPPGDANNGADAAAAMAQIDAFKAGYEPVEYRPARGNREEFIDFGVLAALLVSGAWMIVRRVSSRWLLLQLFLSLLYLGFWRGGCICPVGAVGDVCHALVHPERIGYATLLLFLAPLAFALFAGRVFCGSVCPIGAIQHLLVRRSRPIVLPKLLDRVLMLGPIVVLAVIVYNSVLPPRHRCPAGNSPAASARPAAEAANGEPEGAGATACNAAQCPSFLACKLDPFLPAFLFGKAALHHLAAPPNSASPTMPTAGSGTAWAILCGTLALCAVVALPFCRFVCPFGVLLGLLSLVSLRRRHLDAAQCGNCGRCKRACPSQAITSHRKHTYLRVNSYKCVQCGRCTDQCRHQVIKHVYDGPHKHRAQESA